MKRGRGAALWVILGLSFFVAVVLLLSLALLSLGDASFGGNTAHIKVRGVITTERETVLGQSTASASAIIENIQKADSSPAIVAILLDINSPGGSAVASEELAAAVRGAEKPVVALIRDAGTSGAYWAASSSDFIVASPLSITGSVGATASYLEFSGLFDEYGVGYERIVSGDHKDAGTPFRNLTPEEHKMFQEIIDATASYFVESVRENRNLNDETTEAISSGRIYTGQQALNLGLVDGLGNIETAREAVEMLAGVEEASLVEYRTKEPFSLSALLSQQGTIIGRSIGAALLPREAAVSLK